MAGYNIVFRQLDFTIAAGITNVKSTLGLRVEGGALRIRGPYYLGVSGSLFQGSLLFFANPHLLGVCHEMV